jgi:hypothetical protein
MIAILTVGCQILSAMKSIQKPWCWRTHCCINDVLYISDDHNALSAKFPQFITQELRWRLSFLNYPIAFLSLTLYTWMNGNRRVKCWVTWRLVIKSFLSESVWADCSSHLLGTSFSGLLRFKSIIHIIVTPLTQFYSHDCSTNDDMQMAFTVKYWSYVCSLSVCRTASNSVALVTTKLCTKEFLGVINWF